MFHTDAPLCNSVILISCDRSEQIPSDENLEQD